MKKVFVSHIPRYCRLFQAVGHPVPFWPTPWRKCFLCAVFKSRGGTDEGQTKYYGLRAATSPSQIVQPAHTRDSIRDARFLQNFYAVLVLFYVMTFFWFESLQHPARITLHTTAHNDDGNGLSDGETQHPMMDSVPTCLQFNCCDGRCWVHW